MSRPTAPLLNRIAPLLTAGVITAMWLVGGYSARPAAASGRYFESVAQAIDALPYKIGDWVGMDVPVQPAAADLLNPNKLLQRRYMNPKTGAVVQILIVHCGETRDMLGHYPPVCYPAQGWVQEGATNVRFRVNGSESEAMEYRFRRSLQGVEGEMIITNFFILPGQGPIVARDVGALNEAAESLRLAALGAAQVQILSEPDMSAEDRASLVDRFAAALEPAMKAIAQEVADEP